MHELGDFLQFRLLCSLLSATRLRCLLAAGKAIKRASPAVFTLRGSSVRRFLFFFSWAGNEMELVTSIPLVQCCKQLPFSRPLPANSQSTELLVALQHSDGRTFILRTLWWSEISAVSVALSLPALRASKSAAKIDRSESCSDDTWTIGLWSIPRSAKQPIRDEGDVHETTFDM